MSYAGNAFAADRLLAKFGQTVTLSRPSLTTPTYNPASGTVTAGSAAAYSAKGAVFDLHQDEKDTALVQERDQRLYLSALQINGAALPEPTTRDAIVIGGTTYAITSVGKIAPAGTAVLYDLVLRK